VGMTSIFTLSKTWQMIKQIWSEPVCFLND